MVEQVIEDYVLEFCPEKKHYSEWDFDSLFDKIYKTFSFAFSKKQRNEFQEFTSQQELFDKLSDYAKNQFEKKCNEIGQEHIPGFLKVIMLNIIDTNWKDHLHNLDYLKEGIHLQGMASKDPVIAYKNQSSQMFSTMIFNIKETVVEYVFKVNAYQGEQISSAYDGSQTKHDSVSGFRESDSSEKKQKNTVNTAHKTKNKVGFEEVGRNDPCPCGSGKKFKKCCMRK
jgi:preprotein translocase subunit SecA